MDKQKGLTPILIIVLIALAVGGYLIYQKQTKPVSVPQPAAQLSPTPTASPAPTGVGETANPDSIGANWKPYNFDVASLSFKLPPQLTTQNTPKEYIYKGVDSGDKHCLWLAPNAQPSPTNVAQCPLSTLTLIATSVDFSEGRSAGFPDFSGYKEDQRKYYGKLIGGQLAEFPAGTVEPFINGNGVKIIKLKYSPKAPYDNIYPIRNWVNDQNIGVLINTKSQNYPGVVFTVELKDIKEDVLDEILSTFKFTN